MSIPATDVHISIRVFFFGPPQFRDFIPLNLFKIEINQKINKLHLDEVLFYHEPLNKSDPVGRDETLPKDNRRENHFYIIFALPTTHKIIEMQGMFVE